ncbi:MAG: Flp pilus assembly protein CpaB [Bacillota bacterium]
MKTALRRHRLLFMSLLLGFCAFVSSYSLLRGYVKTENVVVALRDTEQYAILGPGDIAPMDYPVNAIPQGAVRDPSSIIGRCTRTRLVAGQVVMQGHVIHEEGEAGLSHDLPSDKRGMFLPIPPSRALGGLIRPGERVDIIVVPKEPHSMFSDESTSAFTALSDVMIAEVTMDERSDELLGVFVLAAPADCERLAQYLDSYTLYLTLVPRLASDGKKAVAEVWPPR